jgi:hypothetical protein
VPVIAPVVPVVLSVALALTVAESDSESEPVGALMLACESLLLPAVASVAEPDIEFEPSVTLAEAELVLAPVLAPLSVAPPDAVFPPVSPQAASVIVMAIVAMPQLRTFMVPTSFNQIFVIVFMVTPPNPISLYSRRETPLEHRVFCSHG